MIKGKHFLVAFCLLGVSMISVAQEITRTKNAVTYEEMYDEPYAINKLFIHFQPLYGEVFATNVNAGFSFEGQYYLQDKVDFKAQYRQPYTKGFYDLNRDLANKVSNVDNKAVGFNYLEIGGTYHAKDFESDSKTKMFLYKKIYKRNTWAAMVPLNVEIPCKVRKVVGVRLGGILWNSSVDLNRVLEEQGLTPADLKNSEGNGLPDDIDIFSNVSVGGGYVGGSISVIRNVAVSFDKFESGVDDLIFNAYFDILYSPSIQLDDVVYTPLDANGGRIVALTRTYEVAPIKTQSFGFRAGIDGKFNRAFSWAYGGEIGYRPSVSGFGFYAMVKISFPVFSTNLDYKVEAFGK